MSAADMSYANWDPKTMTLYYRLEDDDGEEQEIALPARYAVCPTCKGKGTHVNPSIDAHGISMDEFAEDPDFHEDYMSGAYDVECYGCGGQRVVPEVNEEDLSEEAKANHARVQAKEEEEARYRAQKRHARAMGY